MMRHADFDQAVRALLDRRPFRPFAIEYEEGERFVVEKPEALMYPAFGKTVYFWPDGNFDFLDNDGVKQLVELTGTESA